MSAPSEKVNFVILFQGRTGSSHLIDVLNKHPNIVAEGEMLVDFLPEPSAGTTSLLQRVRAGTLRFWEGCPATRQIASTDALYTHRPGARAIGFKTKVRDVIDLEAMKRVLEAHSVRAIIMQRRNLVKKTASRLNAARLYETTQEWNLHDEADRLGLFRVTPERFDLALRKVVYEHKTLQAFADYLDLPKLTLEYADLLADREQWFASVFEFLGVEPADLDSDVMKNTDDDLRNVLTNYEELKAYYRGTAFEPMFEERAGHPK